MPDGHDTERYGRAGSRDNLPWRQVQLAAPESLPDIDSVEIHFLNDAAGDGGDRNLYVDFVQIGQDYFPASRGRQQGNCPPSNAAASGNLYCAGSVQIPREEQSEPLAHAGKDDLLTDAPRVAWIQSPRRGKWRELTIGLTNVTLGRRQWGTLMFSLVESPEHGFGLHMRSPGCYRDCFMKWPACAWRSGENERERHVFFPLQASKDGPHHCHWQQLGEQDKHLVATLVMLLPAITEAVKEGRRVKHRPAAYDAWIARLSQASHWISASHYSAYVTRPRLLFDADNGANQGHPEPVNHVMHTAQGFQRILSRNPQQLANALLAVPPVNSVQESTTLLDILADPAYDLH